MNQNEQPNAERSAARRAFFRTAGSAAAAVAGASIIASCGGGKDGGSSGTATPTPTPTATSTANFTDVDILTFALNLEYLTAQYYSFATTGAGLPNSQLTGGGPQGVVSGGRQVNFVDPLVANYAREIAADKAAHVAFLRTTLGASVVAQPPLDFSTQPAGAFSTVAQAAGLVAAGASFDAFASDENFLLGAFIFEDVGVTAYKGAAALFNSKTFLDGAAGILAANAYHAGLIRTILYRKGVATPSLIDATEAISNARDTLDGAGDDDQGVRAVAGASNIVPTDSNGLAYSRATGQVLNVLFLNSTSASAGGFFPSGLNSNFTLSAAST